MSTTNAFVWLTGTVTIPVDAPDNWRTDGLLEFYRGPNDNRWGGTLCRVLYHESIHFWHLLSSGYLANAVQDEWMRLQHFEQTGEVQPVSDLVQHMYERRENEPFSVYELVECWARYWDVHTRSPARTIEEDQIDVPASMRLVTGDGVQSNYTSQAYDLFMESGTDAELYAAPYRWLLDQCDGNTLLANVLFPPLVFHAFGTRHPIALLQRSLQHALESDFVRYGIAAHSTRNINFDWLNNWGVVIGEAVEPARADLGLSDFTGGWDVINRGPLRAHPIYRHYLLRLNGVFNILRTMDVQRPEKETQTAMYEFGLRDLPAKDPLVLFGMPGQPMYRLTLGEYLPPPRVQFRNFAVHAELVPAGRKLAAVAKALGNPLGDEDPTFETVCTDFDRRVREFRNAEYAVSVGLPPDAFREEPLMIPAQ